MLYVCIETKMKFHMQLPKVRIKNRSFIQFLNNPHLGITVCNFIVNINLLINKSPNEITEENGLNEKKITFLRLFSILLDTYIHIYLDRSLIAKQAIHEMQGLSSRASRQYESLKDILKNVWKYEDVL